MKKYKSVVTPKKKLLPRFRAPLVAVSGAGEPIPRPALSGGAGLRQDRLQPPKRGEAVLRGGTW